MSVSRFAAAFGAVALLLAPVAPAEAASASIGKLGVGGTGCPAGTVSAVLGSNTLSLKFRSFKASAGGARSFDRKACGVAIPLQVPAGLSVAIVGVTYKGLANLPSGASAALAAEIFFAGGQGPKTTKTVSGPKKGSFSFSAAATATVWSPCGADLNLRVNTSLIVKTGGASASTSITSQDVGAGLVYQLKYRSC